MSKVFFSYSHKDESLRDQLGAHLAQLQHQGLIEGWHDREIVAGSEFDSDIAREMDAADIILLLVSADFLASKYCYSVEMTRAMGRHDAGTARVIPVILRDCDWKSAPFGRLTAVPTDGKPVRLWADIDQALANVSRAIRKAIEEPRRATSTSQSRNDASQVALPNTSVQSKIRETNLGSQALRLKKTFTERDMDIFLRQGFEQIYRSFETSLAALEEHNTGVQTNFEPIDARRFSAKIYRDGKTVSECSIRLEGLGRSNGIAFSFDADARAGSFNEMLNVDMDDQSLYFKAMGLQMGMPDKGTKLDGQGAAGFLWSLLLRNLQ